MSPANAKSAPSTQKNLPIEEIRDNTVIMKDGSLIAVVMVSSVNFFLKSQDEQEALVAGYVQFLNTLEFPLQIVIQSRELNIEGYLAMIREAERKQTNELLKMQTADYREFVADLVELADIMTKRFYVIVPYAPLRSKKKNFLNRMTEVVYPASRVVMKKEKFAKYKIELERRTNMTISGLYSMGLENEPMVLDTQHLIELYYNSYNPVVSAKEELSDISELNVES